MPDVAVSWRSDSSMRVRSPNELDPSQDAAAIDSSDL